MNHFWDWFDTAPAWQAGLVTIGFMLLVAAVVCGYALAVTHDWRRP